MNIITFQFAFDRADNKREIHFLFENDEERTI